MAWGWLVPLAAWLASAFIKVSQNTFAAIQQAFLWMWLMLYAVVTATLASLGMPYETWPAAEIFYSAWSWCGPYLYYANYWVPLSEALSMFVFYCLFWVAFIPIKIVLRHLPVVGG